MDIKYHDSSDDARFANLGISKNDNASYLFNISGCTVSLPVNRLNRLISVFLGGISGHQVVLNYVIHPK